MDQSTKKNTESVMDDPKKGACGFRENLLYHDSNIPFQIKGTLDDEHNEGVVTERIYLNDIGISDEKEIQEHDLHDLEAISETLANVNTRKPYQISSSGFIDTARILTESGHNNAENL